MKVAARPVAVGFARFCWPFLHHPQQACTNKRLISSTLPRQTIPIDDGAGQWRVAVGGVPGFGGPHDLGGVEHLMGQVVDVEDKPLQFWEQRTHAMLVLLVSKRIMTVDELRRGIETLQPDKYLTWGYYDKWAVSMALMLLERGVLRPEELDMGLGGFGESTDEPLFSPGQEVRIRAEETATRWRKPHLRTPGYVFGTTGIVESYEGAFPDPHFLAFRCNADKKEHLYRVRLKHADVWSESDAPDDSVTVEVYQSWLAPPDSQDDRDFRSPPPKLYAASDVYNRHDHDHDHDHAHLPRGELEQVAVDSEPAERPGQRIAEALVRLLTAKNVLSYDELGATCEALEKTGSQAEGPRLVVRSWTDPAFKERLLVDASAAAAELGIAATNSTAATKLHAVESTPSVHNLIVCTLCSCYPLSILGLSPAWYKSRSYRARAVREPRKMLADSFGLHVPEDVAIRVHDSTADLRYIVIPERPEGTEGFSEEDLLPLVTRDSMIGVARPRKPSGPPRRPEGA